jgi:hypothetical protein
MMVFSSISIRVIPVRSTMSTVCANRSRNKIGVGILPTKVTIWNICWAILAMLAKICL